MVHPVNFFKDNPLCASLTLKQCQGGVKNKNPPLNGFKDGKKIAMKKKIKYWLPNMKSNIRFLFKPER
ncbi:MAG: hypothetical protein CMH48_10245 [Muricauda sp.]|nr:hypothetical protein [Allomuricauda sp.]